MIFLLTLFCSGKLQVVSLSTSARWFNYRHSSNAFSIAKFVINNGVGRDSIFLSVGDDPAFDVRNHWPGKVFTDASFKDSVYVVPDITPDEMTVDMIRSILGGGLIKGVPNKIQRNEGGRVLLYLTGHGGEEFLKVRDVDEIRATELAEMVKDMKRVIGFSEMLIILDTCQAESMFNYIDTPGVMFMASSLTGQPSMSTPYDQTLGVPLADLFTRQLLRSAKALGPNASLEYLIQETRRHDVGSTPVFKSFGMSRTPSQIKLSDFFWA